MYNNPYMQNYGQQNLNERIDNQIAQLQQMKEQIKTQQPAINQTFQLAPTNNHNIRYANTIDDVIKENVFVDTPFFSKDMSIMWLKNAKGDIKTYELIEIIPKDEKDLKIEYLQAQIEELKRGMVKNESTTIIDESINATNKDDEPSSISTSSKSNKKSR